MKRIREQRSGSIRIARELNKDKTTGYRWLLFAIISIFVLIMVQGFRKVLFQIDTISFKDQYPKLLLLQETSNYVAIYNQISLKLVTEGFKSSGQENEILVADSKKILDNVDTFFTSSLINLSKSRGDIRSTEFETAITKLFDENICEIAKSKISIFF